MQYWIGSQESQTVLGTIHKRVDAIVQDMANGRLLAHQDPHMLSREYSRLYGEIQGLLFVENEIKNYRDELEEERIQREEELKQNDE